jgi:hypothetical protein
MSKYYMYVYVCMYVCMCVCMYIYIYTHTHIHIHIIFTQVLTIRLFNLYCTDDCDMFLNQN